LTFGLHDKALAIRYLFAIIATVIEQFGGLMISHRVAIATHSHSSGFIDGPLKVIVDLALSGPVPYWKTEILQLLRSHLPVHADRLDAEGLVDVELTTKEFEIFTQALRTIQPCGVRQSVI
jgi:hypothetical protein